MRRADRCYAGSESFEVQIIGLKGFRLSCANLVQPQSVEFLYKCLGEEFKRRPSSAGTEVEPGIDDDSDNADDSPPVASTKDLPPSNKLDSQTTIISSIATQEKLFFTNFHNAAQQLSLLGIKAVGLATQIQAIRGHMMMLKLIDQHIGQLSDDHEKYSGLLEAALKQLETVTESVQPSS